MNHTTTLELVLFAFCVVFNSCKKKPDCNAPADQYYSLSADTIKIIYTGYDTLRFAHYVDNILTDIIVWIGQGKKHTNTDIGFKFTGDGECGYEQYGKTYSILYKANKPGYDLLCKVVSNVGVDCFYAYFLQDEFMTIVSDIDDGSLNSYHSQMQVNGKTYYDVNDFSGSGQKHTFNIFYVTGSGGIIRMELFNKHIFQILK